VSTGNRRKRARRRRSARAGAALAAASAQSANVEVASGLAAPDEPRLRSPSNPSSDIPSSTAPRPPTARARRHAERLAALDLGTNNCRLLIAGLRDGELRIVDAFSRIVRLGEGVAANGVLAPAAMDRAIEALKVCAGKIARRNVTRGRYIATQACRAARNGAEFLERVRAETGIAFEVIAPAEEARLSVRGCVELLDPAAEAGLIFDIGGGSTEISWIRRENGEARVAGWASFPIGVVNLSERWGGRDLDAEGYERIVESVRAAFRDFGDPAGMRGYFDGARAHYLGTSGTVTSIAGVHLELPRYRRDLVDGLWLTHDDARTVTERLRLMDFDRRAAEPCIGPERADLVVCGCAILEALLREWPSRRIRVADRGLREGILADLAEIGRRA
jgi:exopolyphosphatase/guanosine-5'-triphosphate,3'-diphosphate pyrophosphatase